MKKIQTVFLIVLACVMQIQAGILKGVIVDKETGEALIGASVQVGGTSMGTVTDFDGNYEINGLTNGKYDLEIRYVGYKPLFLKQVEVLEHSIIMDFKLESDDQQLSTLNVVARKNMEGERVLMLARKDASVAVEHIGSKEMALKGVGDAKAGVSKMTGISINNSGQVVVRGLGDRYSTTALNGLPIASPNPDDKLVPLGLFLSSIIKNISVSKVYSAANFADYAGAYIDISTREQTGDDFLTVSASVGGNTQTTFQPYFKGDQGSSLFVTPKLDPVLQEGTNFSNYIKGEDRFNTSFSAAETTALPEFSMSVSGGKTWRLGSNELGVLAALQVSNEHKTILDVDNIQLVTDGTVYSNFVQDSYTTTLNSTGLLGVNYRFNQDAYVAYTLFYARDAVDKYLLRTGYNPEADGLIGSNNVSHAYQLLTNQLLGDFNFKEDWKLNWSVSYGATSSDEPDRRQVMYQEQPDGSIELYKLNAQETMRYYGSLNEGELAGNLKSTYTWGKTGKVVFGAAVKDKSRDFSSMRFYYNLHGIDPEITNIYDTEGFINQESIANGSITVTRDNKSFYSYQAGLRIMAGFAEAEYRPIESFLISAGLRYENVSQWVRYWNDQSREQLTQIKANDFFPALNLKYDLNNANALRFAFSRTITRPSFVEMAPFKYQESFGGTLIRGNADLTNGYNYNFDLRYDFFSNAGQDMVSGGIYYKWLETPIERIQRYAGATPEHSFQNAESGIAMGIEIEVRKALTKDLRIGANASYMYTNVVLPEGGSYSDSQRSLQGASPYLANADISYTPTFENENSLALSLVYNLQGPRIHAVGLNGLGNIEQKAINTLDFISSYRFAKNWNVNFQAKNLLNAAVKFTQEVPSINDVITVEEYKKGISLQVGLGYKF